MTFRYLVDTNTLSAAGHPQPNRLLALRMRRHQNEIATAAPVFKELLFGLYRLPPSRNRQDIERFVFSAVRARIPVLPYDAAAADWHASERARLVALGRTPPFVDGQIAAVAAVNGLILVTANLRDFQQFRGLQIENWIA